MNQMNINEIGIIVDIKKTYCSSLYAALGIKKGNIIKCLGKSYFQIENICFVFDDEDKVFISPLKKPS